MPYHYDPEIPSPVSFLSDSDFATKLSQFLCAASQRRKEQDLPSLHSFPTELETTAAQAHLIPRTPALILPLCTVVLPIVHLDNPTVGGEALGVWFIGPIGPVCHLTLQILWDHSLYRQYRERANHWMACKWTVLIVTPTRQKSCPPEAGASVKWQIKTQIQQSKAQIRDTHWHRGAATTNKSKGTRSHTFTY